MGVEKIERTEIIAAGFPCQDISLAGHGAGLSGKHSGLWWQVRRCIRMVRPRYALLENVAALLNRGMGQILGSLARIGYDSEWNCIRASAVGACHKRNRLFILAYPCSERPQRVGQVGDGQQTIRAIIPRGAIARALDKGISSRYWESFKPQHIGMVARVPHQSYRIKALGNSVCPAIVEILAETMKEEINRD